MTEQQNSILQATIKETVTKIARFQERHLGEQNTKASLIEPILEAIGWAIRDPDEVHREFKPTSPDRPVDYCLNILRKPRLLVEAKGLGETLSDRKWIGQILGYATVAGVEWCVLTDGNEYRFYNATVALDADEKLFFQIRLSENPAEEVAKTLKLISRENMAENLLEAFWNAHYVDRRVRHALVEMFNDRDKGLVRLIRHKAPTLKPSEILESLRRLDVRIESPSPLPGPSPRKQVQTQIVPKEEGRQKKSVNRKQSDKKISYDASLSEIITAGILSPPLRLFRKYKSVAIEAVLLPDGGVEFQKIRYTTCSSAAETARSTVTGRKMNTNGWSFWQYIGDGGKTLTLAEARDAFLAKTSPPPS